MLRCVREHEAEWCENSPRQREIPKGRYEDAIGLKQDYRELSGCSALTSTSADATTSRIQNISATSRCVICSQTGASRITFNTPRATCASKIVESRGSVREDSSRSFESL